MAFLMFSILPMPQIQWKPENMRSMLAWLPLVGAVIAAAQWLWFALCQALNLGTPLFAAGLTLLPILLSGGIHMDGFCDTVDALASHASPQRKREILKDPHAGAFAVIFTGCYLLLFFALCAELPRTNTAVLALGLQQVLARALGALCSVRFPSAAKSGLQYSFQTAASKGTEAALLVWAVLCAAALCALSIAGGIVCAAVFLLCFFSLRRLAEKEFGGMSGDLAGYIITLSALLMCLGTILIEKGTSL